MRDDRRPVSPTRPSPRVGIAIACGAARAGVALILMMGVLGLPSPSLAAQPFPLPYSLVKDSHFAEGCFEPCLCPIFFGDDLRGRWLLDFTGFDQGYRVYAVRDVELSLPALGRRYTGDGRYLIGGRDRRMQQLQLNLIQDGMAPVKFDSGLVPVTSRFPFIVVAISRNGFFCFDTAFYLKAAPAQPIEMSLRVEPAAVAWDAFPDVLAYDAVAGRLGLLRATGGDFGQATTACLASASPLAHLSDDSVPDAGDGFWYLVRADGGVAGHTFDSGGSGQSAPRDPSIGASPLACP